MVITALNLAYQPRSRKNQALSWPSMTSPPKYRWAGRVWITDYYIPWSERVFGRNPIYETGLNFCFDSCYLLFQVLPSTWSLTTIASPCTASSKSWAQRSSPSQRWSTNPSMSRSSARKRNTKKIKPDRLNRLIFHHSKPPFSVLSWNIFFLPPATQYAAVLSLGMDFL